MLSRALALVVLLALGGCARAVLPYQPDPQPRGGRISAGYQVIADQVRVEIDTGGRVLEQAWIIRPDGTAVAAHAVDAPPVAVDPGPTVGVGIGSGTAGRRVGVGAGVGVTIPIGGGTPRARGTTVVWFPLEPAGPPPWDLYVRVAGIEPITFAVGGPLPR